MVFSRRVCWPATAIRDSADILCLLVWTDDSCSRKSRFSVVLRRVLSGILSQNRLSDGKRASAEPAADIAGGCGDAGGCVTAKLCRYSAQRDHYSAVASVSTAARARAARAVRAGRAATWHGDLAPLKSAKVLAFGADEIARRCSFWCRQMRKGAKRCRKMLKFKKTFSGCKGVFNDVTRSLLVLADAVIVRELQ